MPPEPRFFLTQAHDCSYLPGRSARTLILDPEANVDRPVYAALSRHGFRRSGQHVYRPHCDACGACKATRVPVAEFKASRRQRRVLGRNTDIEVTLEPPSSDAAYFELFDRYLAARHADGDMYPTSVAQFEAFLTNGWSDTQFLTLRLAGDIVGVAVTDRLPDALSAIYTFFDPAHARRSLGVFAILAQIEQARLERLPWLYLGYWVRDSAKMAYKTDYRPVEVYTGERWQRLE